MTQDKHGRINHTACEGFENVLKHLGYGTPVPAVSHYRNSRSVSDDFLTYFPPASKMVENNNWGSTLSFAPVFRAECAYIGCGDHVQALLLVGGTARGINESLPLKVLVPSAGAPKSKFTSVKDQDTEHYIHSTQTFGFISSNAVVAFKGCHKRFQTTDCFENNLSWTFCDVLARLDTLWVKHGEARKLVE